MITEQTFEVKMSQSYEVDGGLWVEVNEVYHICPMDKDGKLGEDTLCGLKKIGYGREWGYRLAAGETACDVCAKKGKCTKNKSHNMQNYELVLKKRVPNKTARTEKL